MSKLNHDLAFEIPSKTFIVGEYLAINGTASLLLATDPSFFIKCTDDKRFGFHPESPAGQLKNKLDLKDVGFSVFDPHEGRGGFGRSTAEYLSAYLYNLIENEHTSNITDAILNNLEEFIHEYQQLCGEKDYKPSGADLVAQVCGGLCWYDGMNFLAEKLAWPFPGYEIFVFHTGKKLATHEHLKDLKKLDFKSLIPILIAARTSLDQANLRVFCESINYYYDVLGELGLSDTSVQESVYKLRKAPEILAAKGCGAMGVDTVIAVAQSSDAEKVKALCFAEDFQFITSINQSHRGAQLRRPM